MAPELSLMILFKNHRSRQSMAPELSLMILFKKPPIETEHSDLKSNSFKMSSLLLVAKTVSVETGTKNNCVSHGQSRKWTWWW
jgi:hypothetical protein